MGINDSIKSDNVYTLRQLLSGEGNSSASDEAQLSGLTMVIPDMQRDYCWGREGGKQLHTKSKISLFVSGLIYLYKNGKDTPLGLLYGYEEPKGSGRIMIIDGQQRLTTLYLLIGMLYRRTPTMELRRLLMSDYELIDNKEPRLLYQSRTEAQYFMSDLVINFFLDRNGRLSQLEKSCWYYPVYDSDPTVQSFIKAIRQIDEVLEEASLQSDWDFGSFAEFVADQLVFLYHDLGTRAQAENVFVTLNTTGEPLTYPQSVKSLLVAVTNNSSNVIDKWEDMERWAWMHRDKSDPTRHTTSDEVLERFLRFWIAGNKSDEEQAMHPDNFEALYAYFKAYRRLIDCVPEAITMKPKTTEGQFAILPVLAYIQKWGYSDTDTGKSKRNIADMWGWLTNLCNYTKMSASGSDTESALKIVDRMPSPDITSLLKVRGVSEKLLNSDERAKLSLIAESGNERALVHRIINKALKHPLLNGKMHKLLTWSTDKSGNTDLNKLAEYVDAIYQIWGTDIDCNPVLDDLRRALLTIRHPEFPIKRRGNTCMSLCWRDYDWQRLMTNAPGLIRLIIDRVSQMQIPDIRDALKRISNKYADRCNPYYFLIKNADIISRCQHRMLLCPCQPFMGFYLHDDNDADWATDMRWYVEQIPLKTDKAGWTTLRAYGARCLYTDHRIYNLSIDLYYTPDYKMPYRIELFMRDESDKPKPSSIDIASILSAYGYPVKYDKKRKRDFIILPDAKAAVSVMHKLIHSLR